RSRGPGGPRRGSGSEKARKRGPSPIRRNSRALRADETVLVCLVRDDLAGRDLRRIRKRRVELLVAHPGRYQAGRLLALLGRVEDADGSHDAVAAVDEVVATEARQLAQAGHQRLADLALELVGTAMILGFVTPLSFR